jgi:YacP-like NYN domain
MPYLVDGNNLTGGASDREGGSGRAELLRDLSDRLRATRGRITVVFDGPSERGRASSSLGALTVRYSGSRSADDVLVEMVSSSRSPRDCFVVTDDRGLGERVREAGGRVVGGADFRRRISPGRGPERPTPGGSTEDWLEYFSDPRNRKV